MARSHRLLDDGEELVHELRPHWWELAGPAGLVAAVVAAVAALWAAGAPEWLQVLAALAAPVVATRLVVRYAAWASSRILLTSQRVVVCDGVVARRTEEVPLALVAAVRVHQGVRQRVLRAGDLCMELLGGDGELVVHDVPHVWGVRAELARLLRRRGGAARGPAGRGRGDGDGDDRTMAEPAW